jgi:hypothetical protein
MELLDGADAPLEPLAGVSQVAHDESLLPPGRGVRRLEPLRPL